MLQAAIKKFQDFPEEFKYPLSMFDEDVLRLLRQCLNQPKGKSIKIKYKKGQALFPGNMQNLRESQRNRLKMAVNSFRNKMCHKIEVQLFTAELEVYVNGTNILQDKFLLNGSNVTVTNGIPVNRAPS